MQTTIRSNPDGSKTLVIEAPINPSPTVSSTGKSLLLVTTSGFTKSGLTHNGKPVSIALNVTIPNR